MEVLVFVIVLSANFNSVVLKINCGMRWCFGVGIGYGGCLKRDLLELC